MKRTLKYALGAVMLACLVMPALGQDNFPDVPANHWAYDALVKMKKDGLLVGYPDGLFRGSRPASRYELAVAMNAVYQNLKNQVSGLQDQIDALKGNSGSGSGVSADDIAQMKDAISSLQSDMATVKSYGTDIANLKQMADEFSSELKSLGVDTAAMKQNLADLAARVAKLEGMKPPINISGDAEVYVAAGNSQDNRPGLNKDARLNGWITGAPAGLTRDLAILDEAAFTFSGTNETGPKWTGTMVVGDTFGAKNAYPSISTFNYGGVGYASGPTNVAFTNLQATFRSSVSSLGFSATVGRVGYKISPYVMQRPDPSEYFYNKRWDNGKYAFDGGIFGFNFGSAKLDIFGGENTGLQDTNSNELDPMLAYGNRVNDGASPNLVSRSLGANLRAPLGHLGALDLSYLFLNSDGAMFMPDSVPGGGRITVYGGSLNLHLSKQLRVGGGYDKSELMQNTSSVYNSNNDAWHVGAGYMSGKKWGVNAAYREIGNDYSAPGDWGRIGVVHNPTNIKGFTVGAHFNLSKTFGIYGRGEFDKGLDDNLQSPINTSSTINDYNVGLHYRLNSNLGLMLNYENDQLSNLPNSPESPQFQWYGIGFGYRLGTNANLHMAYEISNNSNLGPLGLTWTTPNGTSSTTSDKFTGGFLSMQLSIKF